MNAFRIPAYARAAALGALALVLVVIAAAAPRAAEVKAGDIVVLNAWSRATSGGAGAVYVTLRNEGAAADTLIGASTDAAQMSHLHESKSENGVMTMRAIEGIDIPAHATLTLKPAGYHIMLMGLAHPLKEGDAFPIALTFAKGGTVSVQVVVKSAGASGAQGSMDKMDMGTMGNGSGK